MATPWFQIPYTSSVSGNLGIFDQAPVAAPVQAPAQAINVDYSELRKRKALADTLRGAQKRGVYGAASPLSVTSGANGGPDIVEINYGGILQNALKPYFENKQEEDASAAEAEAQAARSSALEQILGSGDTLSKRDALLAQENLGVDVSSMVPEEMNLAARAQASQTRAGLNALLQMGQISPEDHAKATAGLDAAEEAERQQAREDFLWKQQNTYRAPVAGPKPSAEEAKFNLWQSANPGKNYNDYLAAVGTGTGKQTKAEATKAAETAEIGANLSQSAADLRALIESDKESELFGGIQGLSTAASNIGEKGAGTLVGELASYAGGKLENPMTTQLRALNLDAVLEQARKLAPVTDTDFNKLMLSKPNAFKTKESALAFVEHLERVAKRYGIPMDGSAAPAGLPWSPDLGMTETQWKAQTPEWQKQFMEAK